MAHPNEDLVRKGYAAFQSGDMATLSELLSEDIVWHAQGHSQLSGDFRGRDAVLAQLQKTFELSGGSFSLAIHDVLANDAHVVVLVTASAQREGKTLKDNSVQVFEISDGKVAEQWLYPADMYATDEFWGQG